MSVLQAFFRHVTCGTNLYVNKAIHMLLLHRFGTLNVGPLCSSDQFIALSYKHTGLALENMNINENILPPVD